MKYAILGPTASGKTAYAISLAQRINGAIISADSRQVYAGMNIGTAKPKEAWRVTPHAESTPDIVDGIPHYLLNVASLDTPYTLSDWLRDAKKAIAIIENSGKTPIIAGGTMLYIDALIDGYSIPSIAPNEALRAQLEQLPTDKLYERLLAQDPDAKTFIEAKNSRRIVRALEAMHATGKKFSAMRTKKSADGSFTIIGIFNDYERLRDRITTRCKKIVAEGLQEEIQNITSKYPTSNLLQTMNYKEQCDVRAMVQSNMRYAHRQMSWWRRRSDIGWICAE